MSSFVSSDDEVGAITARSAPAMFAAPICRRSQRNASRAGRTVRCNRFRWIRRRRRLQARSSANSAASGAI